MRIVVLVTVATLAVRRDCLAQDASLSAQAIPLVTRADPTAGARALTEGYLTQPVVMGHAAWNGWRAVGTLDLEGLTLGRGELNTGAYGEGYVDRRHPHTYVHELLAGYQTAARGWDASIFAGRGFAPFGSDDPMTRPFVKYPVNHHLSQVLERIVAIAAVRAGPAVAELGTFNGDEPLAPGSAPNYRRFGDSWASRVTLLPAAGLELAASFARVASPEVRVGRGLDQRKSNVVARFSRATADSWRYAVAELDRTDERDRDVTTTTLRSALLEGALCRNGFTAAARLERTDRPEEEPLLDPFRVARPATDLHNLGVSRWTIGTLSFASPRVGRGILSGRPFVEIARMGAAPGGPAGIFSPEQRYGARRMWMLSAGARVRAGASHDRMGRYGAALPPIPNPATHDMPMAGMTMRDMTHQSPSSCSP